MKAKCPLIWVSGCTPGEAVAAAALLRKFGDGEVKSGVPAAGNIPGQMNWITGTDFPESENVKSFPRPPDDWDGSRLAQQVIDFCRLKAPDLSAVARGIVPPVPEKYLDLNAALAAGIYYRRNYDRDDLLLSAIKQLAAGTGRSCWTPEQREAVKFHQTFGNREIIGNSPAIRKLRREIRLVAGKECARILIHGESGTGKESVVWEIHNRSSRRGKPMVVFNCASVNPQLLESRFLGYEKGAFTGADRTRAGIFEQADGSTLFLDEIGELPLEAQGLLLRVLEDGWFRRVGEGEELCPDVRLICASHRNLADMVAAGQFRQDLFFRINTVTLEVPPLRERLEDLAEIAGAFRRRRGLTPLTPEQLRDLKRYDYPGNVRELLNILNQAETLEVADYRQLLRRHRGSTAPRDKDFSPGTLAAAVREYCRRTVEFYRGNLTLAAAALKISRSTLRKHLAAGAAKSLVGRT